MNLNDKPEVSKSLTAKLELHARVCLKDFSIKGVKTSNYIQGVCTICNAVIEEYLRHK